MQNFSRFFGICFVLCCSVFVPEVWSEQPEKSDSATNPSQEILRALLPESQQKIMLGLAEFATQYQASENAVSQFLLRQKRQQFLAKQLKERTLSEWIGRIKTLRTANKGKAYLTIELTALPPEDSADGKTVAEFKATVGTWNNAYTDLDYNTLIFPGTLLHTRLTNFKEGEWVLFSGKSFAAAEDYLKEASPTEAEAMLSPQFILKFNLLEKVTFPEVQPQSPQSPEGKISLPQNSKISKSKGVKISKPQKFRLFSLPELTLRYYQNYRLSNYDWDYQNYIERWHRLVRYHWQNHPPSDYLEGKKPEGGEVFILAIVERDGRVSDYQINDVGKVSEAMRQAAFDAVGVIALPPLPESFPDEKLKVEFRFEHPALPHLFKSEIPVTKAASLEESPLSANSKMAERLFKKQRLVQAQARYHEELRQEFSAHFEPLQRFDPESELVIEVAIEDSGKVVEWELTNSGTSAQFQLAVLNGLRQARLRPLPKLLRSEVPYRVRLRVMP